MSDSIKPAPEGILQLTPHLVCQGAIEALEFYKKAFGAVEDLRLLAPGGGLIHAALRFGGSMLMLAEENPAWGSFGPKSLKGSPVTLHLCVANVDAFVERAVTAGAKVTMPVADMFWGDRYGQLEDPFGHRWSVATQIRKLSPAEMQQAALEACK